ncbi:MAG: phage scaffolding protein [Thiobacillus sp.]
MTTENAEVVQQTAPKPPETFSREYVAELRGESATYRTKSKEAESRAEAAEAAAKAAKESAAKETQDVKANADQRVIRAELKAVAVAHGMIDMDGLKLADLSKVTLDEHGEVVGAEDLMKALKESKPYLFKAGTTSSTQDTPKKKDDTKSKTAQDMTDAEWKAEKRKLGLR